LYCLLLLLLLFLLLCTSGGNRTTKRREREVPVSPWIVSVGRRLYLKRPFVGLLDGGGDGRTVKGEKEILGVADTMLSKIFIFDRFASGPGLLLSCIMYYYMISIYYIFRLGWKR